MYIKLPACLPQCLLPEVWCRAQTGKQPLQTSQYLKQASPHPFPRIQVQRQQCQNVPTKSCDVVGHEQCNNVPKQHCFNNPEEKCESVPRQRCQSVPRQQCRKDFSSNPFSLFLNLRFLFSSLNPKSLDYHFCCFKGSSTTVPGCPADLRKVGEDF